MPIVIGSVQIHMTTLRVRVTHRCTCGQPQLEGVHRCSVNRLNGRVNARQRPRQSPPVRAAPRRAAEEKYIDKRIEPRQFEFHGHVLQKLGAAISCPTMGPRSRFSEPERHPTPPL
jgi:hypothetical protein